MAKQQSKPVVSAKNLTLKAIKELPTDANFDEIISAVLWALDVFEKGADVIAAETEIVDRQLASPKKKKKPTAKELASLRSAESEKFAVKLAEPIQVSSKAFIGERLGEASDRYYDVMEKAGSLSFEDLERSMMEIIALDPLYFDPYTVLAHELRVHDREEEAQKLVSAAFSGALNMIVDDRGQWPQKLEWPHLENRHILRALHGGALQLWALGEAELAKIAFRQILRMNPWDNQGVRWILATMLAERSFQQYLIDASGGLSQKAMETRLKKMAKKYPDYFPGISTQ